jgi:hypothetical protein
MSVHRRVGRSAPQPADAVFCIVSRRRAADTCTTWAPRSARTRNCLPLPPPSACVRTCVCALHGRPGSPAEYRRAACAVLTCRRRLPTLLFRSVPVTDDAVLCPRCGAKMVMQFASRGPNAGNCFWGCSRFPQCRGSRTIDGGAGKAAPARPRTAKASRPARSSDTSRGLSLRRGDLLVSSANTLGAGKLVGQDGDGPRTASGRAQSSHRPQEGA